jgi:hypothetical protein
MSGERKNPLRTPLDSDDVRAADLSPLHVRWTEGVPVCGAVATDHQMVDPAVMVATLAIPGAQTRACLECLQLLSELRRYRDARIGGMPDPATAREPVKHLRMLPTDHCAGWRQGDAVFVIGKTYQDNEPGDLLPGCPVCWPNAVIHYCK